MLKKQVFEIASIYVPVKRAKTLDTEKTRAIAESIREEGQNTPLMIRPDGDRFVLIEGLHRPDCGSAWNVDPVRYGIGVQN